MAGRPLAAPSWASAPIEYLQHKRAGGQEVIAASRSVLGVRIHPPLAPEGCDVGTSLIRAPSGGGRKGASGIEGDSHRLSALVAVRSGHPLCASPLGALARIPYRPAASASNSVRWSLAFWTGDLQDRCWCTHAPLYRMMPGMPSWPSLGAPLRPSKTGRPIPRDGPPPVVGCRLWSQSGSVPGVISMVVGVMP